MMFKAVGRLKVASGSMRPWYTITNQGEPFFAEKSFLEFAIEEMAKKHPEIEYMVLEADAEAKAMVAASPFTQFKF